MGMAERIKERRIALGLTQEELGNKVGLQKSAIAKYENGRVENVKRSIIQKMAIALECSPSYLLGFEDDEYYYNPDVAALAEEMRTNKEMAMLFDEARDATPENIMTLYDMLLILKRREKHTDEY